MKGIIPVEGSTVVWDCIAIVACIGHTVSVTAKGGKFILKLDIVASMKSTRWWDIFLLGKIEPVEREGDCGTELLFEPIALRESLQVDDQDLRKPVEGISLRAFSSRLASFARWHLVAVKHLLLRERIEAVEEGDLASSCRDPKTEIPERLERDRLVRALRTPQSGLELANKQVDKLRIVATNVTLPRFHCLLAHAEAAVDLAVDRGRLRQHLEFKKAQCQRKKLWKRLDKILTLLTSSWSPSSR